MFEINKYSFNNKEKKEKSVMFVIIPNPFQEVDFPQDKVTKINMLVVL